MKINLKIVDEVVSELVGEDAINIVHYLNGKSRVSEFEIAEKSKLEIHEARTVLYRLFENNLASFVRKKDKRKGWYVCYWDFVPDQIDYLFDKIQTKKISKLEKRLRREQTNEFYMCKHACTRMDFDQAVNFEFKCPECGELLYPIDNKRTIEFLSEKLKDLKKEFSSAA